MDAAKIIEALTNAKDKLVFKSAEVTGRENYDRFDDDELDLINHIIADVDAAMAACTASPPPS
jgi:hypothetical protein